VDLSALVERFDTEGVTVETGDLVPGSAVLQAIGQIDGLSRIVSALEGDAAESAGVAAACLETALEGLYLTRRISKDELPGRTVYGVA
jgi:magnesium chelatase subunit I